MRRLSSSPKMLCSLARYSSDGNLKDMPDEPSDKAVDGHEFPPAPDTSDLDERLTRLKENSRGVQEKLQATEVQVQARREVEREDALGLGKGLQIAYAIIGFPVLGFVIGLLLDHSLGTNYWKGLAGFTGMVLAVVAALILIKQANSDL
jgi:F0F1-type ATP synthase assembly protein I